MKEEDLKVLKNFIEQEIQNSDDQFQLSVEETQEVFKSAIKVMEEISGQELEIDKFKEFLNFYKVMKIVEKVSEELRTEKYLQFCKRKVKTNE